MQQHHFRHDQLVIDPPSLLQTFTAICHVAFYNNKIRESVKLFNSLMSLIHPRSIVLLCLLHVCMEIGPFAFVNMDTVRVHVSIHVCLYRCVSARDYMLLYRPVSPAVYSCYNMAALAQSHAACCCALLTHTALLISCLMLLIGLPLLH